MATYNYRATFRTAAGTTHAMDHSNSNMELAREHAKMIARHESLELLKVKREPWERDPGAFVPPLPAKSQAERSKAHRERGKAIACTLSDPKAIAALEALTLAMGSQRAAIEYALQQAVRISCHEHRGRKFAQFDSMQPAGMRQHVARMRDRFSGSDPFAYGETEDEALRELAAQLAKIPR